MSTAPTAQEQFDERASGTLAAIYLTPDVVAQRDKVMALLAPRAGERALDIGCGPGLTTEALAQQLKQWQLGGDDVALVIGGPDGLEPAFRDGAHQRMRLSDLTLPHAMVRVLLIEQLYRAWSINANHPYHRE